MAVVLVVDDEPLNLRIMERTLRRSHKVLTASGVEPAKAVLETTRVDFIVSDLVMDLATGLDLFRWVTEHQPALGDRFIICSGGGPRSLRDEIAAAGIRFLHKPFQADELLDAIQRAVTPSEPRDSASPP